MGTKEGIMQISMTYIEHGDQVLVPDPDYPTYFYVYQFLEPEIIHYDLREENLGS